MSKVGNVIFNDYFLVIPQYHREILYCAENINTAQHQDIVFLQSLVTSQIVAMASSTKLSIIVATPSKDAVTTD